MGKSVNQVTLLGRLTRDLELRTTPSGKTVAQGSLAVDRPKDGVDFFDLTIWDKGAEVLAQYTKQGSRILVMGRLVQDTWDDKETGKKRSKVTVTVNDFTLLDSKSDSQGSDTTNGYSQPQGTTSTFTGREVDDRPIDLSEIPF